MKKYLAAAVVAVMVFAFAAFAASLNVNAGTLQAGEAMGLDCADAANVAAWGYHDAPPPVVVAFVDIVLEGNECDNSEHLHVILLDSNGGELARGVDENGVAPRLIDSTQDRYRFDFSGVHPADVEGIRIGIDQGHQDYTYD